MINPKEPVKKEEPKAEEQTGSPSVKAQEPVAESPAATQGVRTGEPLAEVLGRAELAYAAYMDAPKAVDWA